ncbi:MAG: ferrochelatase [Balneolaceae bacterium]|nr:ferrochelatase [Balneolaceae bacterium]MCH8549628.1 ferrochelatase [Balneolaceae bacterium]
MRIGIVLMNLGGPTHRDNVKIFLKNLFQDEDIIKLGGGVTQKAFANIISKLRAPSVAEDYMEINGCPKGCTGSKHCFNRKNKEVSTCCSPINGLTEAQRRGLEKYFKTILPEHEVKVYTCMRYWLPFADQVMDDLVEDEITHTVLMPLYPQFSWTTTGSSFRDWETVLKEKFPDGKPWKEFHVKNYYLNESYLASVNDRIDQALNEMDEETRKKTHLIFSAHGTPLLEVRSGDPYTTEIKETMEAVMARREEKNPYWLSFQSRVGPQKWTQPNTEDLVERHLEYGIKNFLMVPIAFVTDHIETLYELGVELVEDMEEEGFEFENYKVMEGLNDHPKYLRALAEETLNCLKYEIPDEAVQWDEGDDSEKAKTSKKAVTA